MKAPARLTWLVAAAFASFSDAGVADWLERLTRFDRPQASEGIMAAAELTAELAMEAGASDVDVAHVAPSAHAWTFVTPPSWTPEWGVIEVERDGATVLRLDLHPERPMSLATGSAAVAPSALGRLVACTAPDLGRWPGDWLVVDGGRVPDERELLAMQAGGARGFVACPPGPYGAVPRVELPPAVRALTGLVLDREAFERIDEAARHSDARVRVAVRVGTKARAPLVTGRAVVGTDPHLAPVLIVAHLCHRAPGANDNASGVAAVLAVVAALQGLCPSRTAGRDVRFLTGPEFTGTAHWLHRSKARGDPLPIGVVNLDMVGEDQQRCGGPLVVEGTPDHVGSFWEPLLEACFDALPAPTTWAGTRPAHNWGRVATPFAGASDHLLFADRSISRPAVQIGHWPDRFNHSEADTLDKVDREEVRRVTAAVAAACAFVVSLIAAEQRWLSTAVAGRASRRLASLVEASSLDAASTPRDHLADVVAVLEAAQRDLASVAELVPAPDRAEHALHVARLSAWLDSQATAAGAAVGDRRPHELRVAEPAVVRTWTGPFHLRGLAHDAGEAGKSWLRAHTTTRDGYARAVALALAIDDESDLVTLLQRASLSSDLPLTTAFGEGLLATLVEAGWARLKTRSGA